MPGLRCLVCVALFGVALFFRDAAGAAASIRESTALCVVFQIDTLNSIAFARACAQLAPLKAIGEALLMAGRKAVRGRGAPT